VNVPIAEAFRDELTARPYPALGQDNDLLA
jgi:hypothetical protein